MAKRTVVSHEVMAGRLAACGLFTILEPLIFDHKDEPLELINLADSTCVLCLLNLALRVKNVLLSNSIDSWKEGMSKISCCFPNALVSIGFISGEENPSDNVSKFFSDSVEVLNSDKYRIGPEKYNKLDTIK